MRFLCHWNYLTMVVGGVLQNHLDIKLMTYLAYHSGRAGVWCDGSHWILSTLGLAQVMLSRNKYLSGAFIDQVQRFHRPSFEPTNFSLRVQALSRKKGLNQLWHLHCCCRYFGFYMLSLSITTEIAERICRRHHGNPFYTPEPDVAWLELWGNPWFDGESSRLGLESSALEFGRLITILVVIFFMNHFVGMILQVNKP